MANNPPHDFSSVPYSQRFTSRAASASQTISSQANNLAPVSQTTSNQVGASYDLSMIINMSNEIVLLKEFRKKTEPQLTELENFKQQVLGAGIIFRTYAL